ncbi:ArsR/SmtB family transcription factor [Streptomyces chrestomyceticus]|uniref:ArsR/SmtB family transcription factor n=1 Tax=Streptomyces chrestomyceticus TaxID=68185 RepID=UPI0033D40235
MNPSRRISGVSSQRIHCTLNDLLRLRVSTTVAPHVETFFALRSLSGPGAAGLTEWQLKVFPKLGRNLPLLKKLSRVFPSPGALLRLLQGKAQEVRIALVRVGETVERLADAVHEFWRVAVAPYWSRIRARVQAEQASLERMLAVGGVEHLLSSLQGGGRWSTPVLELPHERDEDIKLDGRGLLLVPSLFLPPRQGHLLDRAEPQGQRQLLLSTGPVPDPETFWSEPEEAGHALAALVGATRASVLEALVVSRTTGELARWLGISGPGASQHTAVLRGAGLIATHRDRNTARHELTPLGRALLRDRGVTGLDDPADDWLSGDRLNGPLPEPALCR